MRILILSFCLFFSTCLLAKDLKIACDNSENQKHYVLDFKSEKSFVRVYKNRAMLAEYNNVKNLSHNDKTLFKAFEQNSPDLLFLFQNNNFQQGFLKEGNIWHEITCFEFSTDLQVVEIDLSAITTVTNLHQTLKEKLSFPQYYGQNWDAFLDCMRDILANSKVEFQLKGRKTFMQNFPRDARLFFESLTDLQDEHPERISVFFLNRK